MLRSFYHIFLLRVFIRSFTLATNSLRGRGNINMEEAQTNSAERIKKQDDKLKFGEKLSYSFAGAAETFSFAITSTFMVFFYTDFLKIDAGVVGTILFISQVLSAVAIIWMGRLFDKKKNSSAKGWIMWLAVPHSIALILAFCVPNFGTVGKIIYAFVTYNLLITVCYSAINLAYSILNTRMTSNQLDRSDLSVFRTLAASVVTIIVNLLTMKIVAAFGNNARAWTLTMLIYGVGAALLFTCTYLFTKERIVQVKDLSEDKPSDDSNVKIVKNTFWKDIKIASQNKYCILLMVIFALNFAFQGTQNVYVYYCTYFLKDANVLGLRSLAGVVILILTLLSLHPLIHKFGKRNLSLFGSFICLIGYLLVLFNTGSIILSIVAYMITTFGSAPFTGAKFAMVSDSVEYGEWKTGIRTEGMTFSIVTFGQKIGTGIGAAMTGWLLSFSKYVPQAKVQSAATMNAILGMMVWVPVILCVAQIVLLWRYHLDREYPTILQELRHRKVTDSH